MKKAGVAASGAKVSFEETNAAIQVLAGVGVKGAEAGTALRGVFIKLQTQTNDNFNPAIVGINKSLENLAEAELSATDMVKLFGQENFVAAQSLIANRENLKRLTGELTGTNVALEQAAKRQATFEAQSKLLASAFEVLQINLGEKLLPILTDVVRIVADIINDFADASDEIEDAEFAFADLDEAIRTVVATFSVLKTATEIIGKVLGGVAAAVVTAFSGDFAAVNDILKDMFEDTKETAAEGFAQVAAVVGERTPALIEGGLSSEIVVDAARDAGKKVGKGFFEGLAIPSTEAAEAAAADQLAELAKRVENIRQGTLTEAEAETERFETIQGILFQGRLANLENQAFFDKLAEDALFTHEERLTKIANKGVTERNKFEEMTTKQKANFVLGTLQKITAGASAENKKMFRINQAVAIGNAIVNTASAITSALAVQPFPVGLALAVVAAAAGAAQIATIASAKPGGGGGKPQVGASAGGGSPVGASTGGPQSVGGPGGGFDAAPPETLININIDGLPTSGMMQAETVRELMSSINDQLGDGVNLDVDGGTAGGNAGTTGGG